MTTLEEEIRAETLFGAHLGNHRRRNGTLPSSWGTFEPKDIPGIDITKPVNDLRDYVGACSFHAFFYIECTIDGIKICE